MKANYAKSSSLVKTTAEVIEDLKKIYLDGNMFIFTNYKGDSYIDLINIENEKVRFFTCLARKQGSGKRSTANKVVRLRINGLMLILEDVNIKETTENEIKKHELISVVSETLIHTKCVPVFHSALKSRVSFDYFFKTMVIPQTLNNKTDDKVIVVDTVEKEEKTATEVEEVTKENVTETIEESEPILVTGAPKSEEDLLIDKMVELDTRSIVPLTKELIDRMMNISSFINDDIISKTTDFDDKYIYCQEICQQLTEKTKVVESAQSAAEEINKFICILSTISFEYKKLAKKAEQDRYMLSKTLEKVSEDTAEIYNAINSEITKIEEENNEKKLAEQKVTSIMENLSDLEKELLMKSLGLGEVSIDVVTDPTPITSSESTVDENNKFTIIMNDGNTREIDNSWFEIEKHLRQVALKRETINVSVFQYIADQMSSGMTRKDLISALGSQHYAKRALDICSELGLYTLDRSLNGKKRSAVAAAKGGRTLSEHSQIKKRIIEEDIRQKAAKICAE
jgi:hypothetical protein